MRFARACERGERAEGDNGGGACGLSGAGPSANVTLVLRGGAFGSRSGDDGADAPADAPPDDVPIAGDAPPRAALWALIARSTRDMSTTS